MPKDSAGIRAATEATRTPPIEQDERDDALADNAQRLILAESRMPKVLAGLQSLSRSMVDMERFCRKEPRALLPADVAEMWRESRETLVAPLIKFVETGE